LVVWWMGTCYEREEEGVGVGWGGVGGGGVAEVLCISDVG
jgi:hypothetical protein